MRLLTAILLLGLAVSCCSAMPDSGADEEQASELLQERENLDALAAEADEALESADMQLKKAESFSNDRMWLPDDSPSRPRGRGSRRIWRILRALVAQRDKEMGREDGLRRGDLEFDRLEFGRRIFRRLRSLARLLDSLSTSGCRLDEKTRKRLTSWSRRLRPFLNRKITAAESPARSTVAAVKRI